MTIIYGYWLVGFSKTHYFVRRKAKGEPVQIDHL